MTEPLKLEPLLGVLIDHGVDFIIYPDPAADNLDRLSAALAELEAEGNKYVGESHKFSKPLRSHA